MADALSTTEPEEAPFRSSKGLANTIAVIYLSFERKQPGDPAHMVSLRFCCFWFIYFTCFLFVFSQFTFPPLSVLPGKRESVLSADRC